jgi:hypothetical protein
MLLLVVAASVTLSVVMERTANNIRRNEAPLLNKTIPQLRYLGDFESALLRYQLALDKRYGIDHAGPLQFLESMGRGELDASRATAAQPGRWPGAGRTARQLPARDRLTPSFERNVGRDPGRRAPRADRP